MQLRSLKTTTSYAYNIIMLLYTMAMTYLCNCRRLKCRRPPRRCRCSCCAGGRRPRCSGGCWCRWCNCYRNRNCCDGSANRRRCRTVCSRTGGRSCKRTVRRPSRCTRRPCRPRPCRGTGRCPVTKRTTTRTTPSRATTASGATADRRPWTAAATLWRRSVARRVLGRDRVPPAPATVPVALGTVRPGCPRSGPPVRAGWRPPVDRTCTRTAARCPAGPSDTGRCTGPVSTRPMNVASPAACPSGRAQHVDAIERHRCRPTHRRPRLTGPDRFSQGRPPRRRRRCDYPLCRPARAAYISANIM